MRINCEPKAPCPDETSVWLSRIDSVEALSATVQAGQSVTLVWKPSADPTVVGYNIYYGVASRTYTKMVNAGNVASATMSGLVEGTTYYFAATACNTLGLDSGYSNETSYTVPTALSTVQTRVTPNGEVVLRVSGQIGHTYDILALQTFTAWTVIGTVTLGANGTADFTDSNAASYAARNYRTRETHETERKGMKLKIEFGEETGFDKPIRQKSRTRAQWLPSFRLWLRALAMAERTEPIKSRID